MRGALYQSARSSERCVAAQVPAALGLPHDAAKLLQGAAATLGGGAVPTPARMFVKQAFDATVGFGMATGGLQGPLAHVRRYGRQCSPPGNR